jgi:uncharacterized membrane protein YjfL (UPF0719 family)
MDLIISECFFWLVIAILLGLLAYLIFNPLEPKTEKAIKKQLKAVEKGWTYASTREDAIRARIAASIIIILIIGFLLQKTGHFPFHN